VFYNRINDEKKVQQIGVIAQELEPIVPQAVTYCDVNDEYGVSYGNLAGLFIEAIKEQKTIAMICKEFCVCESQVNAWKKQLKESGSYIFENNINSSKIKNQDDLEARIKE
jgi:hypothetical protein